MEPQISNLINNTAIGGGSTTVLPPLSSSDPYHHHSPSFSLSSHSSSAVALPPPSSQRTNNHNNSNGLYHAHHGQPPLPPAPPPSSVVAPPLPAHPTPLSSLPSAPAAPFSSSSSSGSSLPTSTTGPVSGRFKRPQAIQVIKDAEFREMRNAYQRFAQKSSLTPLTATTPSVAVWGKGYPDLMMPLSPQAFHHPYYGAAAGGGGSGGVTVANNGHGSSRDNYIHLPPLGRRNNDFSSFSSFLSSSATEPRRLSYMAAGGGGPPSKSSPIDDKFRPDLSHYNNSHWHYDRPPLSATINAHGPTNTSVIPSSSSSSSPPPPTPKTAASSSSTVVLTPTPTSATLPPIHKPKSPSTLPGYILKHTIDDSAPSNRTIGNHHPSGPSLPSPAGHEYDDDLFQKQDLHQSAKSKRVRSPTSTAASTSPYAMYPGQHELQTTFLANRVDHIARNLCAAPHLVELHKNTPGPRPSQGLIKRLKSDKDIWKKAIKIKKGYFSCVHCGKRFATLARYAEHIEEFAIERPFLCSESDCPWSVVGFYKKTELLRHEKSQHGSAIYACTEPHCERMFTRKDSLKRHLGFVHAGPPKPWSKRARAAANASRQASTAAKDH